MGIFIIYILRAILNNRFLIFWFIKDLIPLKSFTLILFICIKYLMLITTFFIFTVRFMAFTLIIRL